MGANFCSLYFIFYSFGLASGSCRHLERQQPLPLRDSQGFFIFFLLLPFLTSLSSVTAALSTGAPWLCSPLPPQGSAPLSQPLVSVTSRPMFSLATRAPQQTNPSPSSSEKTQHFAHPVYTTLQSCPWQLTRAAERDQPMELVLLHNGAASKGRDEFQPPWPTVSFKSCGGDASQRVRLCQPLPALRGCRGFVKE